MSICIKTKIRQYTDTLRKNGQQILCETCGSDQTTEAVQQGYRVPHCTQAAFSCLECGHHIRLRKLSDQIWINDVITYLFAKPTKKALDTNKKTSILRTFRVGFKQH